MARTGYKIGTVRVCGERDLLDPFAILYCFCTVKFYADARDPLVVDVPDIAPGNEPKRVNVLVGFREKAGSSEHSKQVMSMLIWNGQNGGGKMV